MNAGIALYDIADSYLKAVNRINKAEVELINAKNELATAENALRQTLGEDSHAFSLLITGETLVFTTGEGVKFVFTMGSCGETPDDIQIKTAISL